MNIDLKKLQFYKNPKNNEITIKINNKEIKMPKDWITDNFGSKNLLIVSSGIKQYKGYKKYYATGDIKDNKLSLNVDEFDFDNRPSRANMEVVSNSIWFAKMKNTIKHLKFIESNKNILLSTGFQGIQIKNYNVDYCFFKLKELEIIKNNLSYGSTQESINDKNTKMLKLSLPSTLLEQQKIASILIHEESLIKSKKEYLSKYKKQKKFFQQELLSARLRIKLNKNSISEAKQLGFIKQKFIVIKNEEIKTYEIVEDKKEDFQKWINEDFQNKIEFYKNGKNNWKKEKLNGRFVDIPCDWIVEKNQNLFTKNKKSIYSPKIASSKSIIPLFNCSQYQTLFINEYISNKESILLSTGGLQSIHYVNEKHSYTTDVLSINILNINTKYYYYYFQQYDKLLEISFQGSGLKHLSKTLFEKLKLAIPSTLLEQTLISTHLTKLDNIIGKLEEEITKEEKQFTFLKQELLSGRLRVK